MSQRILVVEDNDQSRRLMAYVLTFYGYDVFEARDGEEGVKIAREQTPELILMDLQMPVMNGLKANNLLKSDPETRHIKIIAVTSFAMKGDEEKIMAAGFDGYISKPINTRKLPGMVKRLLSE